MSELLDLFGEWAHHADGTPYQITLATADGEGAWGTVTEPADPVQRPVLFGNRMVRNGDGSEVVSSVLIYGEPGDPFTLGSLVTIDGTRTTTVLRVDPVSHAGMFDYLAVFCE